MVVEGRHVGKVGGLLVVVGLVGELHRKLGGREKELLREA